MKYKTIVADPPWYYGHDWGGAKKHHKSTPMPYEQMSLDEIKALPVGELADVNCEIYLWVTQKYLPYSFDVIKAWGFKYCQMLTWCKSPRGTGQGGVYCPTTEFLILGRIGRMPAVKRVDRTAWEVPRQKRHSQKPEFFMELIESVTDAPRIELFARRQREGWDVFGDEVENSIEMRDYVKAQG